MTRLRRIDNTQYMKKILLFVLILTPLAAMGQNHQYTVNDTAVAVVDRYLERLNFEALPQDSQLVMETAITFYGEKDTIWMRRWYTAPQCFRIEVWNRGKLETGLIGNGKDFFRQYSQREKRWETVKREAFYNLLQAYDFRGPLYNWRVNGATLTWNGTTTLKGERMNVVKVQCPQMYERYYMFEPESGLLTLIVETEKLGEDMRPMPDVHIEWKSCHEYLPLGRSLLPSLESFMRQGTLTILSTDAHFEKANPEIFEKE